MAMRRPWTLRMRLVVVLLLLGTVGLAGFGVASVVLIRQSMIARIDDQLRDLANRRGLGPPPEGRRNGDNLPTEFFFLELYTNGSLIRGSSTSAGPALPVITGQTIGPLDGKPFFAEDKQGGAPWRVIVHQRRPPPAENRPPSIVMVAQSMENTDATVTRLIWIEVAVGIGLLLAIGAGSFLLVRLGLRPLDRIERTAGDIAAGDLDLRVAADSRTEVGRLGGALNTMVGRLSSALRQRQQSETRLRRFVADASHELRTPLTSIRGFAELHRRGGAPERADVDRLMSRIEGEAIRMGALVEDLLMLARLDQERALDLTELDIRTLVEDAVHDARARDPEREVILEVARKPIRVTADEHRMRQVITNLISNAMTHTPQDTPIQVRVGLPANRKDTPVAMAGTLEHYGRVVLEVIDEGPGIPLEAAPNIFDRFYRVDEARTRTRGGTGLGLAITAAILEAHGGRVELRTAPGEGARFTVLLPLP
ncbi:HAMP domain-containing histidine kinase [Kibdelosporangium philippinense]|uniref:histidine kinase n=1 Tax=Kibdelosporangium philippinense TaxID=211113 RepID=A0ABS8ZPG9_9PSEU|nr:HAMP domain-containing sensor histidine kinase [Kibdelosporangium philippinense]MCE7009629.1 HAMP domain-containing histidine kinase [Kibdelosporangium philippinense]